MSLDLTLKKREFNFNLTNSSTHKVYEFEDFRLDTTTRLLYRSGEQLVLTPKAVETLIALVDHHGTVVAKEELMTEIWADTIVEESNLAQYLHVLRKTLGSTSGGTPFIETLKRRGYRFNGTVRVSYERANIPTPAADPESDSANGSRVVASPVAVGSRSRRIERRGNVLAVADWIGTDESVDTVGQSTAVQAADPEHEQVRPTRFKIFSPSVFIVLLAVVAGLAFAVYEFSKGARSSDSRSVPFLGSDITRLTTTGRSKRAAISPDGRYVAHSMASPDGDSLWVRQVAVARHTHCRPASERSSLGNDRA